MLSKVISLKDFRLTVSVHELKKSVVIYGGTFDPFHYGHLSIVKELIRFFPRIIIAPSNKNPWKETAPTPLDLRIEMIKRVLDHENISYKNGPATKETEPPQIEISDFKYYFSEELIEHLNLKDNRHVYWAIGEDLAFEVTKWRNWDRLHFTAITFPININIRATQIREGHAKLHQAIEEFAKVNRLYPKKN